MGQLTSCRLVWVAVVVALSAIVEGSSNFRETAPNCHFVDVDLEPDENGGWIIRGSNFSEKAGANEIIWNVETENIIGARSYQFPDGQYLTGLRYLTRYVYRTSEAFPNFVKIEGKTEVNRQVLFDCQDGGYLNVSFQFPLTDVNEPPKFIVQPEDNLQVDLTTVTEDTIINEGDDLKITVRDPDFTPENNQVEISSDRSELIVISSEVRDDEAGVGKLYDVILRLNLTNGADDIPVGIYSLNLFSTDGQLSESTKIGINVFRSE